MYAISFMLVLVTVSLLLSPVAENTKDSLPVILGMGIPFMVLLLILIVVVAIILIRKRLQFIQSGVRICLHAVISRLGIQRISTSVHATSVWVSCIHVHPFSVRVYLRTAF